MSTYRSVGISVGHVTPQEVLTELEPVVGELLERHLATAKEWFPHEHVPYGRGRDFDHDHVWSEADTDIGGGELSDGVRSALFVNLLTEDNLPYYFRDIERMLGSDGAFGEWTRRWTAEEGRHSIAIRDYLTATRAVDPVVLERARMAQVSGGQVPQPMSALAGIVYVSLQELATRIAHRNTGKLIGDPAGYDVMARVAADENLHHLFYRDLTAAAIEASPSDLVIAIEAVVRTFAMPGTGIPDFERHSAAIAAAGIYDVAMFHEQVLVAVVIKQWRIPELTGLTAEAETARDALLSRIERVGKLASKMAARRERASVS
ncbi:MAG: acyl-ACP desaturase [Actinomycetota bacterium]|nr:MAG: acyl-ACP desaturase [Actinomycetota bacterium]